MNKIEFRVVGLMRSGNHAIIDWIRGIFPDQKILFLNNIAHGDMDPFDTAAEIECSYSMESIKNQEYKFIDRDILIYSYEDQMHLSRSGENILESALNKEFELSRSQYLGTSSHFFTVYILRDPFNCFASRLQMLRTRGSCGGLDDMNLIKDNWKVLARKALKVENGDKLSGEMLINFNKWSSDFNYRSNLSRLLMGSNSGVRRSSKMSFYGGGSSFASNAHEKLSIIDFWNKRGKLLKIQNILRFNYFLQRLFIKDSVSPKELSSRWKKFSDDNEYLGILKDEELLDLSEKLFDDTQKECKFVRDLMRKSTS